MADQRPAFRFRLPWLPPQPPIRPAFAPRPITPPPALAPPPPPPRETQTPALAPPQTREPQAPNQTPTSIISAPSGPQVGETQSPTQTTTSTSSAPTTSLTTAPPPAGETQFPVSTLSSPTTQIAQTEAPSQSSGTAMSTPTTLQRAETQASTQPIPTTPETNGQKGETQLAATTVSSLSPTAPQTAESTPTIRPPATSILTPIAEEKPSLAPPVPAPTRAPQLQVTRTESRPSSPSRAATQSRIPSKPSSPSQPIKSRLPSQPSSPSRPATQPRVPSQPSPQSRPAAQSLQPSSPSASGAQPQVSSMPALPFQASTQPKIPSRPVSPSHATNQPKTSPKMSSPTSGAPVSLPDLTSNTDGLSPSYSPPENNSSLEDKKPNLQETEKKSPELEQKPQHVSGLIDSTNRTHAQPSNEFNNPKGFNPLAQLKKEGTPKNDSQSDPFLEDLKPEEMKEVKEVMQEIANKVYGNAKHKDNYHRHGVPDSKIQAKEQSSISFQSEPTNRHVEGNDVTPKYSLNGTETRTTQQRNKTMLGDPHPKQGMSNGEQIPLHKEIRDDISKLVHKMAVEDPQRSINDRPVNVITLAGENRGASMHLGSDASKRGGAVHIHRGYKIKPDESDETTTNEEGSSKEKSKYALSVDDQAREAYINSNVQGINNSIMFESSVTERNPGVHMIHSRSPKKSTKSTGRTELLDTENGKSNMIHAQKLTYQPMVKRRCLRGLFLESSDSDPDDNSKPRRHGCRVGCSKKSRDNKDATG